MKDYSNEIIDFPTSSVWGEFYSKFRKTLIAKLDFRNCLADREDAVEFAFDKLMNKKDKAAYGEKMPNTEKGWFWALYWQAKAFLSHMKDHGVVHAKYVEEMSKELEYVFAPAYGGEFLDNGVYSYALSLALDNIIKDQDLNKRDLSIFIENTMYKKSAKILSEKYNLTENNVYQIKFRMKKILNKYGKKYFNEALKKVCYIDLRHTA
jgi:hypothetical protein